RLWMPLLGCLRLRLSIPARQTQIRRTLVQWTVSARVGCVQRHMEVSKGTHSSDSIPCQTLTLMRIGFGHGHSKSPRWRTPAKRSAEPAIALHCRFWRVDEPNMTRCGTSLAIVGILAIGVAFLSPLARAQSENSDWDTPVDPRTFDGAT